jgi:hypothetical protein
LQWAVSFQPGSFVVLTGLARIDARIVVLADNAKADGIHPWFLFEVETGLPMR